MSHSKSLISEVIEQLPMTLKENKDEIAAIHALQLIPEDFRQKQVIACKMPSKLSNLFVTYADDQNIPFYPSNLRAVLLYFYPEILGIYFDWDVIHGNRYWLFLPADFSEEEKDEVIEGILTIVEDWLNGFSEIIEKFELPPNCLNYEKKALMDLYYSQDFDRVIIPFIGNEIIYSHYDWLKENLPEIHYTRHQSVTSIVLPTEWLPDHNDTNFSLLSNPIIIKQGKRKITIAYRIKMIVDNTYNQKRINFYLEKTRFIMAKLVDDQGKYSFHPNPSGEGVKQRTSYVIINNRHRRKMIRVPVKWDAENEKPVIFFGKMTRSYLRLNTSIRLPDYHDVFEQPSRFHGEEQEYNDKISFLNDGVFIPYQLEDMGRTHNAKSGLSLNEHQHIFNHVSSLLPYKRVEAIKPPIYVENALIQGGSIKKDRPDFYVKQKLEVVVATDSQDLAIPIVKAAIEEITKPALDKNGELKMMNGKFAEFRTTVHRYIVSFVKEEKGTLTYLYKDQEFPGKGDFQLIVHFTDKLIPYSKSLDRLQGYLSSTLDRIDVIKELTFDVSENSYFIIDMPNYKNKSIDPKAAVKFALLEKGFVSHNIDVAYLKNIINKMSRLNDEYVLNSSEKTKNELEKLKSKFMKVQDEMKQKVRMTFYKIFEKEGFTNQMIHVAKSPVCPVYFADKFEFKVKDKKPQYVYALSKFENGKIFYKFTRQEGWYEYGEAMKTLGITAQMEQFIATEAKFFTFIKDYVEPGSVVFLDYLQKDTYEQLHHEYNHQQISFEIGLLSPSKYKNPYIAREKHEEAMFGPFLTKDEDYYFSVPPKPITHQIPVHLNSQLANKAYLNRTALKIKTTANNWSIIEEIHRLRNISLTYASYLSVPYPLHILQNTFKNLFGLNPLIKK
ncbi:hypothetical protein [Bacillus sp. FJAT-29814]|uniref:hypothetical protein n=1 Tax=Bacillus sp. FJAT-29814 TaxID=1729688 RepID=UPI0008357A6E|nr:hypothetical protein [Bacillus sp. FJAT-29814]